MADWRGLARIGATVIRAITLLLACQLAGEAFVRWLGVPFPGPVLGMVLLVGGLLLFKTATPVLEETADTLLRNLSLLFVPAAVGVIQHGAVLKAHGTAIVLALLLSTIATLAVTALVFAAVSRRMAGGTGGEATNGEDTG
jgi:putative effector of murein hydrolase LrgA (UPF0299 family)